MAALDAAIHAFAAAPHTKLEESASFLKKRSKKLLFAAGVGDVGANARRSKSFLLLFFKKEALLSFPSQTPLG